MQASLYLLIMVYNNEEEKKALRTDKNTDKGTTEYVDLWGAIVDMGGNLSIATFFIASVTAFLLTMSWGSVDYCENQRIQLCGDILILCSCILGFSIAGFSVILSLNNDALSRLSILPTIPNKWWKVFVRKKSTPYDILCASFSSTCIILLLTIIVVIIYKNMPCHSDSYNWLFVVIKFFSLLSALLVFDLTIHLYTVSTYINTNHNRVKMCNKKQKEQI